MRGAGVRPVLRVGWRGLVGGTEQGGDRLGVAWVRRGVRRRPAADEGRL